MRRLVLFVPIAIVVVSALPSAAGAIRNRVVIGPPRVELQPAVVGLRERATIAVSGIHARSLEVLLAGATDTPGNQLASQLPWLSLQLVDGAWRGTLPAPALRGIYRSDAANRRDAHTGRRSRSCGSSRRAPARGRHLAILSTSFAGGCAPLSTRNSWHSKLGPAPDSICATRACTASSSSRTARRDTRRPAIGWACSSRQSETATADAGGSSRRASSPNH